MAALRILVKGRVQGVGFRHFATNLAMAFGVTGEVWNRGDGAVEIQAEHPDAETLRGFVVAVEEGPGWIRDVGSEPAAERGYSDFTVGPTR